MIRILRYAGLVLAIAATGCSDNAIKLRFGIESAAKRLASGPDLTEERVSYVPVANATKGYWVVFFPERRVSAEELVARGMPKEAADRIYRDLGYVDVGLGPMLVIDQEGERLAFTSYRRNEVIIRDLIVEQRTGRSEILLRKQDGTVSIEGVR
jgi:hypothetical protein